MKRSPLLAWLVGGGTRHLPGIDRARNPLLSASTEACVEADNSVRAGAFVDGFNLRKAGLVRV